MSLRLYNTLSRQVEEFVPLTPGRAGLYTCGPTVYNTVHIGNLRTFLFEDLLCRSLRFLGFEVTQIMNLLHLAPDIQEELLFLPLIERGRDTLLERQLRPIAAVPD